jgi:prepilin-type processing-associated H-X9-DG protein
MLPHPRWARPASVIVFMSLAACSAVLAVLAVDPADRTQVDLKLNAMRDDLQAVLDRSLVATDQVLFRVEGTGSNPAIAPRSLQGPREATQRVQCQNNLKQIGLALSNYYQSNNSPPLDILDAKGRPILSWRVALLPYFGVTADWDKFRYDRPWDDPVNLAFARNLSFNPYSCPVTPSGSLTNYVAITGQGTAMEVPKTNVFRTSDGLNFKFLAVECVYTGIHWMEPRDLTFRQLRERVNDGLTRSISSRHPGGANVVLSDGSVRFISDELSPEVLRRLAADEQENVKPDDKFD